MDRVTEKTMCRLLLVEDDLIDQMAFKRYVKREKLSYQTVVAASLADARGYLRSSTFDVIVSDYLLGDGTAMDLFPLVSGTPIIVVTGGGDEGVAVRAMKAGAHDYLIKDLDRQYLQFIPVVVEQAIRRRRSEEELRQATEFSRSLVGSSLDMIIAVDQEQRVVEFNQAAAESFGYARSEILGVAVDRLYADPSSAQEVYRQLTTTGRFMGEVLNRRRDGEVFTAYVSASILKDSQGNPMGFMGVSRDITEQKRLEAQLAHNYHAQQTISSVLQVSLQPVGLQEQLARILRLILEIPWLALEGKGCIFLTDEEDPNHLLMRAEQGMPEALVASCRRIPFGRCLCGRAADTREMVFCSRMVDCAAVHDPLLMPDPLQGDAGGASGYDHGHYCIPVVSRQRLLGVLNLYLKAGHQRTRSEEAFFASVADTLAGIVERKKIEEALRRAKESADAASRAKSEFLANMSHEIRTPMNAIIGMTELSMATEVSAERGKYLAIVMDSAEALLSLLNGILDFSKIEAGRLELEEIPFDPRSLVEKIGDTMAVQAQRKGLTLYCRVRPTMPRFLGGDPNRLRQVLVNLVSNAVKFTEEGEVVVDAWAEAVEGADTDRAGPVVLAHLVVSDTGIGIPSGRREAIFDSFTQGDGSTTRRFGGTGLGLAISRRLVEMMHGRIWVESEEGKGSRFRVAVPMPVLTEGRKGYVAPEVPVDLQGRRVLVVDPEPLSREILRELLVAAGALVEEAASGSEGLGWIRQARATEAGFHAVLLEARTPDISGFDLARTIRRESGARVPVVVMLLRPNHRRDDIVASEALGVAHLVKPIKQGELLTTILLGYLPGRGGVLNAAAGGRGERQGPVLDILLVEDNLANAKLTRALMERIGHRVWVAENGHLALGLLATHHFDLVLMDLQLPEMDGFATTRLIRTHREGRFNPHVPIVAMTAHAVKGYQERCLAAGMNQYLAKPFRAEALFGLIAQLFPAGAAKGPAGGEAKGPVGGEAVSSPSLPVVVAGEAPPAEAKAPVEDERRSWVVDHRYPWLQELSGALSEEDQGLAEKLAQRVKKEANARGRLPVKNLAFQLILEVRKERFGDARRLFDRLERAIGEDAS